MNDEVTKRLVELSDHLDESDAPGSSEMRDAVDSYSRDGDNEALRERENLSTMRLRCVEHIVQAGVVCGVNEP